MNLDSYVFIFDITILVKQIDVFFLDILSKRFPLTSSFFLFYFFTFMLFTVPFYSLLIF